MLTDTEEDTLMLAEATFPSYTIRVDTPDGTMFVHICENEEEIPVMVRINIGKVGTNLMAWADSLSRIITLALQGNSNIYEVLQEVCNISSDKLVYSSGIPINSGPDGLTQAILIYLKHKEQEQYDEGEIEARKSYIRRRHKD